MCTNNGTIKCPKCGENTVRLTNPSALSCNPYDGEENKYTLDSQQYSEAVCDTCEYVMNLTGNITWLQPTMNHASYVRQILSRKKKGEDCTESESAEIKMFVKEHLVQIGNGDVKLIEEIQEHFPLEYGEAIDEINPQ